MVALQQKYTILAKDSTYKKAEQMKDRRIAPSLLAADFSRLGQDIELVNRSEADYFHIDVMDGVFVPNISFGFPVIKHIKPLAKKPLDVHLMIVEPDKYIERFREHGAHILTVHYEACHHLDRTLNAIREAGMLAGVSLNPHTPVELLENVLELADLVLIMSVNPGYGGQSFIENSYRKIRKLREMIDQKGTQTLIEVDGGVDTSNAGKLYEAGVNVLVSGSFIFSSKDPLKTISQLKKA